MILKPFEKAIKWLIFTNIYIAIAAVCFQGIIFHIGLWSNWNAALSVNTFFSTWLVYQFSRWNFHKNYEISEKAQEDEIYQFVNKHQQFTKITIAVSFLGTIVSCFFLRLETLSIMAFLGLISMIYPLRIGGFSLRSIPFLKIFLIAFVWATTAIVLPYVEVIYGFSEIKWGMFATHYLFFFLFIILITLPFDIKDKPIDVITGTKTIPALLGRKATNNVIIVLEIILFSLAYIVFYDKFLWISIVVLLIFLAEYAQSKSETAEKWKIMAIYDGSMILLFLLTLILNELWTWSA